MTFDQITRLQFCRNAFLKYGGFWKTRGEVMRKIWGYNDWGGEYPVLELIKIMKEKGYKPGANTNSSFDMIDRIPETVWFHKNGTPVSFNTKDLTS